MLIVWSNQLSLDCGLVWGLLGWEPIYPQESWVQTPKPIQTTNLLVAVTTPRQKSPQPFVGSMAKTQKISSGKRRNLGRKIQPDSKPLCFCSGHLSEPRSRAAPISPRKSACRNQWRHCPRRPATGRRAPPTMPGPDKFWSNPKAVAFLAPFFGAKAPGNMRGTWKRFRTPGKRHLEKRPLGKDTWRKHERTTGPEKIRGTLKLNAPRRLG